MNLETVKITMPAGGKGAKETFEYSLRKEYGDIEGLYIPEADSFNPDLEMEIRKLDGLTLHQRVRVRHYVSSVNVPHMDRFMPLEISGGDKTIVFDVERMEATASEITFYIVIRYEG